MKAWLASEPGPPSGLRLVDLEPPRRGDGELLVAVQAVGLNFSDLLMIGGRYQVRPPFPFTPGQEITGTVLDGADDDRFACGTRIASKVYWGGAAEVATVRADMAIPVPDEIEPAEAAALPVVYPTAHIGLHARAGLRPGETVLVHAAAGAVGLAAVQVAKAHGARVIAAAGGPGKLELCRRLGADVGVDYGKENWVEVVRQATAGRGVDIVFDSVGGEVTEHSLKVLAVGGRLLIVGFSSGDIPRIAANRLLLRSASAIGVYWSHDRPADREPLRSAIDDILALRRSGRLQLAVTRTYDFTALPDALEDLGARRTSGKVVITVNP